MINKLIEKIRKTNAPIVVGLDPMLGYIPEHIKEKASSGIRGNSGRRCGGCLAVQ